MKNSSLHIAMNNLKLKRFSSFLYSFYYELSYEKREVDDGGDGGRGKGKHWLWTANEVYKSGEG